MKQLISSLEINEARKAGLTRITVRPDALVTPQARDDAKKYGIALTADEAPKPRPSDMPTAPKAAPARRDLSGITGQVIARLEELLAPRGGIAAYPGLASIAASVIGEHAAECADKADPALTISRRPQKAPDSGPLPIPGAVELEEAVAPGPDGPGLTRLSWADSSFEWTFEFDEVLVVTSGTIKLGGTTLQSGEAARVRAGTKLALSAAGAACCVCGSWPKP